MLCDSGGDMMGEGRSGGDGDGDEGEAFMKFFKVDMTSVDK